MLIDYLAQNAICINEDTVGLIPLSLKTVYILAHPIQVSKGMLNLH